MKSIERTWIFDVPATSHLIHTNTYTHATSEPLITRSIVFISYSVSLRLSLSLSQTSEPNRVHQQSRTAKFMRPYLCAINKCVYCVCERAVSNLNPHFRWWYTLTLCRTRSLSLSFSSHFDLHKIQPTRFECTDSANKNRKCMLASSTPMWCCETRKKLKEYSIKIIVSNWAVRTNATVVQCSSCVGYFSSTFYLNP